MWWKGEILQSPTPRSRATENCGSQEWLGLTDNTEVTEAIVKYK